MDFTMGQNLKFLKLTFWAEKSTKIGRLSNYAPVPFFPLPVPVLSLVVPVLSLAILVLSLDVPVLSVAAHCLSLR